MLAPQSTASFGKSGCTSVVGGLPVGLRKRRAASAPAGDVLIRRLHPSEQHLVHHHLERLDPTSRRLRFGNAVNDGFLARYAEASLDLDGVVLGLFVDGTVRGVAELRFISKDREQAEIAFSIEPEHQGFGHGTHLFGRVIDAARNRGVRKIWLTFLAENRRIQAIARKFGATVTIIGDEATAELSNQHPGARSLSREWGEEIAAGIFAMIERQQRRLARLFEPFLFPRPGN